MLFQQDTAVYHQQSKKRPYKYFVRIYSAMFPVRVTYTTVLLCILPQQSTYAYYVPSSGWRLLITSRGFLALVWYI